MKTTNQATDILAADEQGIVEVLKAEHRLVSDILERLASEEDEEELTELCIQLKRELMSHSTAEDRVVYMTIEQNEEMREDIEHARDEHSGIDEALMAVVEAEPGDTDFKEKVKELTECVQHHVDEEENKILPKASQFLDAETSRELALLFKKQKQAEIATLDETEPDLGADGASDGEPDMTRDELYQKAVDLGIEGRSSMTKEELKRAIRRH